jgi:hypothetical protein
VNATTTQAAILPDLAVEINRAHAAVEGHIRAAVPHAIRAGGLLNQAKAALPHGDFGKWISENCTFSERTAQGYMRLSRLLPTLDPAKAQRVAGLPLRDALGEIAGRSRFSDAPYYKAAFDFLDVCREILDNMKPVAEMTTEEMSENMPILVRMIDDTADVLKESHSRRCDALRKLGKMLREAAG